MFPLHQHVYTIHTHNLQAGSDLANPTNTPWQMQMHCLQSQPLEVHLTSPRLTSPLNMLRLLLDHSFLYSQKTPPRFPDDSPDSPDYPDSKNIEILLFNQCTQTPCRLWQLEHYLHSSHHPLAGADGNRKDSKFTFSNSSQPHRYSYSQITARLITFWNFS